MADFRLLPIAQRSVPSLGTRKRQDFLDDCNPGPERNPLRSNRLYCRYCETAWSSICLTVHPVGWEPRKPRFEVPGGWSPTRTFDESSPSSRRGTRRFVVREGWAVVHPELSRHVSVRRVWWLDLLFVR
jgi:hypothetical protein